MTHGDSYLMIGGNGVAFFVFDLRSAVSATWLCFEAVLLLHAQYYYLKQAGRVRLRKNNSVIPAAMLLHKAFFF